MTQWDLITIPTLFWNVSPPNLEVEVEKKQCLCEELRPKSINKTKLIINASDWRAHNLQCIIIVEKLKGRQHSTSRMEKKCKYFEKY